MAYFHIAHIECLGECVDVPHTLRSGGCDLRAETDSDTNNLFCSISWKPMGGLLSYCTHTMLIGGVDVPFGVMYFDLQ